MTTVTLPSPPAQWLNYMLAGKDLMAEPDLASLPQPSNDFGRWGQSNVSRDEWERDLQQVISSLSDYIESHFCSWDPFTYPKGQWLRAAHGPSSMEAHADPFADHAPCFVETVSASIQVQHGPPS
jgi:hypothetical protein